MSDSRRFDDSMFGKIIKLVPLIIVLMTGLVGYGVLKQQAKDDHDLLKSSVAGLGDHERRLIRLEQIAEQIPEMRKDIKDLLRRMR